MTAPSNPRRANGHRRDRLRRRVLAYYTHCHLCGRWVDKTLHFRDPGAPEVDEIIPVSLGGDPLAWSNVQLAERICNQRRGNRLITPKLIEELTAKRASDLRRTAGPVRRPTTSRQW